MKAHLHRAFLLATALWAMAFAASAAEIPTDRIVLRLKDEAPAGSKAASTREALAARISDVTGSLSSNILATG